MEDSGGGSGGGSEQSWFGRRLSNKRNFSTMAASHRDDSPDSLFLPSSNHSDPHYDNEQASQRRRLQMPSARQGWERQRSVHYPGDGLDFRRPVMSTNARESSVSEGNANGNERRASAMPAAPVAAPPVIDLTDEHEEVSEGTIGGRDEVQVTVPQAGFTAQNTSHAAGGHRLPRFGRDVIDLEEHEHELHNRHRDFNHDTREPALQQAAFEDLEGLPGANFLAMPPRRSASGRVQYSTLRRPTRPPSPPQDLDDEEVAYLGSRPSAFTSAHERRPTPGPASAWLYGGRPRSRSITPYPTGLNEAPIDLTEDADDGDDDVLFVNERQTGGLNLEQPNGNAGTRTQAGGHDGFGIGRLANVLRARGADLGGRLAQRIQQNYNNDRPYADVDAAELAARRAQIQQGINERVQNYRMREHNRNAVRAAANHTGGPARVPRVRMDRHGNIPGYQRVGWHVHPPAAAAAPRNPQPNLGDIGGMMNYGLAAFDMGYAGAARPPTPKYSPPPEPARGFTRNPGEDEIVVCPNCGDELAIGESEAKQEIWVNKACGHAYCGDCAQHRSKTKNKKGKGKAVDDESQPPPFKSCVVEGCMKGTSGKAMVRIYFGS